MPRLNTKKEAYSASFYIAIFPKTYNLMSKPYRLEQERDADVRVEREERRIFKGLFHRQTLIEKVRETLNNAEVYMNVPCQHVATFKGESHFHIRRDKCIGAWRRGTSRNHITACFGTKFRIAHQLKSKVKPNCREKVVLIERVTEHNRKLKQHNIQLGLVRIKVHIFFVAIVTVVERKFRDQAEILCEHRNFYEKTCTRIPPCAPSIGIGAKEGVKASMCT